MYFIKGKSWGIQTTEACPNKNPSLANESKSTERFSILLTGTNPPSGPPICMALIGLLNPPPS